jgi:uncharacterized protein (TIGR03435 family)
MRIRVVRRLCLAGAVLLAIAMWTAAASDSFEVASVRPSDPASPDAFARYGEGCDGSFPRVENHRFVVKTTVYALMTWAYGFNKFGGCSFVNYGGMISGGPAWTKSDRFEIQAVMPEDSPVYNLTEFLNGNAPKLELMLKDLLTDRFKLALHRETREASGYALVPGKGGPKIRAAKEEERTAFGIRPQKKPDGTISQHLVATKTSLTYVALLLTLVTKKPVVDRTGLTGDFTLDVEFGPLEATAESWAPSIFTAVQEELGLKLEPAKVPVEVMVIDRLEKPSEN